VAPLGNIRNIEFVAIVGGSGQDFELSQMLMNKLAEFGTVVGTANIRGKLGPVNAVATGLVLSYSNGRRRGNNMDAKNKNGRPSTSPFCPAQTRSLPLGANRRGRRGRALPPGHGNGLRSGNDGL
jgi:hypothetical protein